MTLLFPASILSLNSITHPFLYLTRTTLPFVGPALSNQASTHTQLTIVPIPPFVPVNSSIQSTQLFLLSCPSSQVYMSSKEPPGSLNSFLQTRADFFSVVHPCTLSLRLLQEIQHLCCILVC